MPHFLLRHATPGSDLPGPRPAKSCAMHADCGQPLPGKASRMGTEAGTQQASQSAELPGEAASFWIASMPGEGFPRLDGDISVDVAVVGAGITGLTAAMLLKRAGKTVAVVESKEIARGTTGYTTAKVTAGHRLVYQDLRKTFGDEGARLYADSQQAALERVAELIAEFDLDCDFRRDSHYVYAESRDDLAKVEREVEVEQELGLPASYVDEISLPFPVAGGPPPCHPAQ